MTMRGSHGPGPWVSGCYGETLPHILLGDVHGASAAGRWYPAIEFAPGHNLNASLGEQNSGKSWKPQDAGICFRDAEAHALKLALGWKPGCRVRPGLRANLDCLYWIVLSVQRGG